MQTTTTRRTSDPPVRGSKAGAARGGDARRRRRARALRARERPRANAAELYDWQISAFDGLAGADQAIYNSLYTVKDEIPLIYDDINLFNEPGVKFRWPNLEDFENVLLPPFYRDTSWEQNGSLQWSLHEPLAEGEMQGSTMYLGTDGQLPGQGSFLLIIGHVHAGLHEQQRDRDLVEREESRRDAARAAFATS